MNLGGHVGDHRISTKSRSNGDVISKNKDTSSDGTLTRLLCTSGY